MHASHEGQTVAQVTFDRVTRGDVRCFCGSRLRSCERFAAAAPEKLSAARTKLDSDRIAAIHKFLTVQTEGRSVAFQVVVHDPDPVDIAAVQSAQSVVRMYAGASGSLASGGR